MAFEHGQPLAARDVPDAERRVPRARREPAAVRQERERGDPAAVLAESAQDLVRARVPEPDGPVGAPRRDELSVRTEGDGHHAGLAIGEDGEGGVGQEREVPPLPAAHLFRTELEPPVRLGIVVRPEQRLCREQVRRVTLASRRRPLEERYLALRHGPRARHLRLALGLERAHEERAQDGDGTRHEAGQG